MFMNRFLLIVFCVFCIASQVVASNEVHRSAREMALARNLVVLNKGEAFSYPLSEGAVIQCYAKRIDGSVDAFHEFNDYFVMKDGTLYSNTMHKLYKPKKADKLKKVDRVNLVDGGILKMYDPLWEPSIRHHMRHVKINTRTGEYYMDGTQDNWMWYRNITATGYCRAMK